MPPCPVSAVLGLRLRALYMQDSANSTNWATCSQGIWPWSGPWDETMLLGLLTIQSGEHCGQRSRVSLCLLCSTIPRNSQDSLVYWEGWAELSRSQCSQRRRQLARSPWSPIKSTATDWPLPRTVIVIEFPGFKVPLFILLRQFFLPFPKYRTQWYCSVRKTSIILAFLDSLLWKIWLNDSPYKYFDHTVKKMIKAQST